MSQGEVMSSGRGICEIHGPWELDGWNCPGCEIARLHAQLTYKGTLYDGLQRRIPQLERERDEALASRDQAIIAQMKHLASEQQALAQVEVLLHYTDHAWDCRYGKGYGKDGADCICGLSKILRSVSRLRDAEAVVEALKLYMRGKGRWEEVSTALAAWEKDT